MVAHALHRHSESLVNELERVAHRVVQEVIKNQYSPSGLILGSHRGEAPLQSRPPMPYSLTTPGPQTSPVTPGEGQFLSEPPKEILHGYTCVYIPDNINPTCAGQLVSTGAPGADAEKQAWLAKYATGPSAEPSAQEFLVWSRSGQY